MDGEGDTVRCTCVHLSLLHRLCRVERRGRRLRYMGKIVIILWGLSDPLRVERNIDQHWYFDSGQISLYLPSIKLNVF